MNEAFQSHSNYHAHYTAYIIIATAYNTGTISTIIGPDYVINALVICFIAGTTTSVPAAVPAGYNTIASGCGRHIDYEGHSPDYSAAITATSVYPSRPEGYLYIIPLSILTVDSGWPEAD